MIRSTRTASLGGSHAARRAPHAGHVDIGSESDPRIDDIGDPVEGLQTDSVVASVLSSHRRRRGGGGAGRGGSSDSRDTGLLSDDELREIEEKHPDGLTAVQIVDLFASRRVRFSEATFRKYVQQGLLPRSRRIGRKGKHRGSMGVYPAKTVRRINAIKTLMEQGYTLEEIQEQFLRFTDLIERLEENVSEIVQRFDTEIRGPRFDDDARRDLQRELDDAKGTADELMRRIDGLSQKISAPRRDRYRSTGAAGSAEDLL